MLAERSRVLRWSVVVLVFATGLAGCREQAMVEAEAPQPFVFRSLNLNQRHQDGSRDWDLSSPEARYELSSRTVRARGPQGILYRNNKPAYRIKADLATVLNDGELVILEGKVNLQQLTERKVLIQGDRLVWTPARSEMVIDQRPQAVDANSQIKTRHLTFRQDKDTLQFKGPSRLDRWIKQRREEEPPSTTVRASDGAWNLANGTLLAAGPVQAKQDDGSVLSATRLTGNTRDGYIDLIEPVTYSLPDDKGNVRAGRTRWGFEQQTLSSSETFEAVSKQGRASGVGFEVKQQTTTVIIPADCRVNQPGEQLRARRCSWNWSTDVVIADGDVELKRDELDQITTAARLEGRVGDDGVLRFGAPGQRVRSEIRLKQNERRSSPDGVKRSAPVTF